MKLVPLDQVDRVLALRDPMAMLERRPARMRRFVVDEPLATPKAMHLIARRRDGTLSSAVVLVAEDRSDTLDARVWDRLNDDRGGVTDIVAIQLPDLVSAVHSDRCFYQDLELLGDECLWGMVVQHVGHQTGSTTIS